jgi:hypothetical protein
VEVGGADGSRRAESCLDVGVGLGLHSRLGELGQALVPGAVLITGREVEARRDELHEGVEEEGVDGENPST